MCNQEAGEVVVTEVGMNGMVKTVNTPTEVMSVDRMAMRDVESGRMRYGVKEDNEMACESQSQT